MTQEILSVVRSSTDDTTVPSLEERDIFGTLLLWNTRLLFAVAWASGAIFATYILGFFGGTVLAGAGRRWNEALPGLYAADAPAATLAIGLHFMGGAILLLLGPLQLIGALRRAVPGLHRVFGRIYVVSAAIAGVGGLAFIIAKGTVGGPLMDVGFGLYGALMVWCAALTVVQARSGNFDRHRAWAIRLFALTVGSWLYRMEYGLWFLVVGYLGRTSDFSGWFDAVMVFFFYLPNLVLAEAFIRTNAANARPAIKIVAVALLMTATAFVVAVSATFAAAVWFPRSISGIAELS
jgi:hypothetical protein